MAGEILSTTTTTVIKNTTYYDEKRFSLDGLDDFDCDSTDLKR